MPTLDPRHWRILVLLGTANAFNVYAASLLGLALRQIQHALGVAESDLGRLAAIVSLGVAPAALLTVVADRVGRRRILLLTILGFSTCTALTGVARTAAEFVAFQLAARVFVAAEALLAVVVIAEEFDARTRGWGIGLLGVAGGSGHLLAAVAFAGIDRVPLGWRALFLLGGAPLALLPWLRRNLTETARFERHRQTRRRLGRFRAAIQPLASLVAMYPGRLGALSAALLPTAFAMATAVTFHSKFLQDAHGYAPADVALLYLGAGVLGVIGNIAAGGLADRFGRKPVLVTGLLANLVAAGAFYNAPGAWIVLAFGVLVFTLPVIQVLYAAVGSELFPTSYRSTASGVRAVMFTLGAAIGLWCEGHLYDATGSHDAAVTRILAAGFIAPLVIGLFVPETAARDLDEIAPEKSAR